MSRLNLNRSDRIAQMSKQEELIAKKKQQILDKQHTAELAKAIAAASNKNKSPSKTEKCVDEAGQMKNTFNNDGSFLENFKMITEQAKLTKVTDNGTSKRCAEDDGLNGEKKYRFDSPPPMSAIQNQHAPPPPPPTSICGKVSIPTTSTTSLPFSPVFDPNIPPPLKAFQSNTILAPYPPLHTISPPKPLELNTIPPPRELDLNAIPKPILNIEQIKIPEVGANYKVLSENDKLPTTVEHLVELVAEIGDVYEEKLCSRKNDLHPTFWFLFDKQSEAYKNYRHMIVVRNLKIADNGSSKYDPADILDDKEEEENKQELALEDKRFYDDKSTTETDSDTEYMKEAKERNLKNLKRKTMTVGSRHDDSSTDSDDEFNDKYDSNHEAYENMMRKEAILLRQKHRKKSRWGDNTENNGPTTGLDLRNSQAFWHFIFVNYETVETSEENWKKAEAHYRIKVLYQDMSNKIQKHEKLISNRLVNRDKFKYDSEEDRLMNSNKMKAILLWINELTKLYESQSPASHKISDFLMPDEYRRFMEKFALAKTNRDPDFEDYKKYKLEQSKIISTSAGSSTDSDYLNFVEANNACENGDEKVKNQRKKSRWGEVVEIKTVINPSVDANLNMTPTSTTITNQSKPLIKHVTRTDPALLQYARQNFGSVELTEDDWKKAEEHFRINLLYQDMLKKRQEIDRLSSSGKFKYEYDSDEDVNGGTWEHKLRSQEMEATQLWANALTKQSEGKHHIGDFLPPEELKKFMEKYDAQKNNRQPNLSDYKEYKLKEDNVGFQMLQKLGWKEGQGLGASGSGIIDPVNNVLGRPKEIITKDLE